MSFYHFAPPARCMCRRVHYANHAVTRGVKHDGRGARRDVTAGKRARANAKRLRDAERAAQGRRLAKLTAGTGMRVSIERGDVYQIGVDET